MGHTAIPILMALLSCCVWKNVEVRTTPCVTGNGALVICSNWMSALDKLGGGGKIICIWLADGAQPLVYSISMSLTSIHVQGIFFKSITQLRPLTTTQTKVMRRILAINAVMAQTAVTLICDRARITHTRGSIKSFFNSIFGSLRQVWACVGRENASHGAGMENKSRRVPTGVEEIPWEDERCSSREGRFLMNGEFRGLEFLKHPFCFYSFESVIYLFVIFLHWKRMWPLTFTYHCTSIARWGNQAIVLWFISFIRGR